jgi:hypothetical protein
MAFPSGGRPDNSRLDGIDLSYSILFCYKFYFRVDK